MSGLPAAGGDRCLQAVILTRSMLNRDLPHALGAADWLQSGQQGAEEAALLSFVSGALPPRDV